MRLRLLGGMLLCFVVAGCAVQVRFTVSVNVSTELAPGTDFDRVVATLIPQVTEDVPEPEEAVEIQYEVTSTQEFSEGLLIASFPNAPEGTSMIEVRLERAEAPVFTASHSVTFEEDVELTFAFPEGEVTEE